MTTVRRGNTLRDSTCDMSMLHGPNAGLAVEGKGGGVGVFMGHASDMLSTYYKC